MKRSQFFICILLGLFVMWWFFKRNGHSGDSTAEKTPTDTSSKETVVRTQNPSKLRNATQEKSKQEIQLAAIFAEASDPSFAKYRYEQMQIDPNFDWRQPINFWGKVVDENEQPVTGASIHFTWNDTSERGTSNADTKSDGNGFFSLKDRRGKRLYVDVEKEGYYGSREARNSTFEYADPFEGRFTPDANKPVVFHLGKKAGGEPLICGEKLFGFKADGTQYYLDLIAGKKYTNTPPLEWDVAVRFRRSEGKIFDWSVVLEGNDGGLIETDDEFKFLAPESGYERIEIEKSKDDPKWKTDWGYRFYVKSRGGKNFGRIEAEIIPKYSQNAAISMKYCLNPSGSRNLEYDESVQPKPKVFE